MPHLPNAVLRSTRLFRSFAPETERPVHGLTKSVPVSVRVPERTRAAGR
ncbi:hypothetical protein HUT19_31275 [Streptomyces sp. NA02950]|nr:hypothetical protein [Streptomyces sp. NA02950]QKV95676.1 hypothetical protein HUT19_31275 [Streptomyces sp. NA02950]